MTYKKSTTALGTLTYTYDAAGNRTKVGGTFARATIPPALSIVSYNTNNQQLTFGTNTETYDLNGNLSTVTDAGSTATYTWNARNQLASIASPGFAASFTYDSFGRRTGKIVQGTTSNYVYDGLNPVQEKAGVTVTTNLLMGLGIDEFFTRTDGVGVRALLPDALGSTVALGDGTGTLQTQYTYEPFGYTTQTGLANTNSYKYTGREDDGTGLDYYRERYYHPRLQRFIAEDPIGFSGGDANLYAYAFNTPTRLIDPTGNAAIDIPFPPSNPSIPSIQGLGRLLGGLGIILNILTIPGDTPCDKRCPPCKLVDGTTVPLGSISYRYDQNPANKVQHGIAGDHLNLYIAQQNPNNCKCFWQRGNTVLPPPDPSWIPIQPFLQ